LDCDPGLDDALALLLAHGDPALELVGVTTVGGNVSLENTTRNALELREYLRFPTVPVSAGADRPLVRERVDAAHVHGARGLGDIVLPPATLQDTGEHAADFIVDALLGDLYAPLEPARFEVITFVAPYVPSAEIELLPREARLHEPIASLDGGQDGLGIVRGAIAEAPAWLAPGGWVVTEVSGRQADATATAMRAAGLVASIVRDDELDTTVVLGQYL
ncbi:MAG: nucleoside hydrolase, partial [Rhodoglobus sp.]